MPIHDQLAEYWPLMPHGRDKLDSDSAQVALVRAVRGTVGEDEPARGWDGDGQWIVFETVEVLKGRSPGDKAHWLPVPSEAFAAARKAETSRTLDFGFWDTLRLQTATSPDHTVMTSCGPNPVPTLVPGQLYLALFGRNGIHLESFGSSSVVAVSGSDDPLVVAARAHLQGGPSTLRRSLRDYAAQMQGYAEIRVDACPRTHRDEWRLAQFETFTTPGPGEGVTGIDAYGASAQEVRTADLDQYSLLLKPRAFCEQGRRYLALRRWDGQVPANDGWDPPSGPLVYRYLPITQGTVRRDDILSNVEITGSELIAVDDLKRWIRNANPGATSEPDPALLAVYAQGKQPFAD